MHASQILLQALNAENHVTLQTLHRGNPQRARYDVDIRLQLRRLQILNDEGSDIYFTVNKTDVLGRTNEHIVALRAIWGDYDRGIPDYWPVEPTAIVQSSPGKYQVYWAFSTPLPTTPDLLATWQSIQDRWVKSTGADWAARDAARILRLPGFQNWKYDLAVPVNLLECSGKRYPIEYLEGFVQDVELCPTHYTANGVNRQAIGHAIPIPSIRRRRFQFYLNASEKPPVRGGGLCNPWYYRMACRAVIDFVLELDDAANVLSMHSAQHHGQEAYEYTDMLIITTRALAYGKGQFGSAYATDGHWTIKEELDTI